MNILTLYQDLTHQAPVKASTTKGGEYHGPCPACGGRDRFHVWPEQRDGGTYWCRGCGKAGDLIQFRREFMGEGFRQAAEAAGKEIGPMTLKAPPRPWAQTPAAPSAHAGNAPAQRGAPDVNWIEHATKLVGWAHEQLVGEAGAPVWEWLADRGIDAAGIERFRLGWNPGRSGKDLYRERKSWALPEERKPDGRAKKLWIPRGLIIPLLVDGDVWRVRIRRPEDALNEDRRRGIKEPKRYYVLPGSSSRILVCPGDPRAAVIVETELDAMMLACRAGDLCTAVALGSVAVKPDAECHAAIADAMRILVALDLDDAGGKAMAWWRAHYRQAERWPVIDGKDPGEMVQRGGDVRTWILCGLPPALTIGRCVSMLDGKGTGVQATNENGGCGKEAEHGVGDGGADTVAAATDGRQVHTDPAHPHGDGSAEALASPVADDAAACGGDPGADACRAPGVAELIDILRRHPLGVEVTPTRTRILVRDGWHDPAIERRLSQLVFFDPAVFEWLEARPAGVVTGRNVNI
jgi:hypothetical protein